MREDWCERGTLCNKYMIMQEYGSFSLLKKWGRAGVVTSNQPNTKKPRIVISEISLLDLVTLHCILWRAEYEKEPGETGRDILKRHLFPAVAYRFFFCCFSSLVLLFSLFVYITMGEDPCGGSRNHCEWDSAKWNCQLHLLHATLLTLLDTFHPWQQPVNPGLD